jgi:hypothetical protein
MKIGLLSTLNTNIGDDFIRDGIRYLIRELRGQEPEYVIINKHRPLTAVSPAIDKLIAHTPKRLHHRFLRTFGEKIGSSMRSVYDNCDLIVQCGTPIMWQGCSQSEWAGLIWRGIFAKLAPQKAIYNIAGGSCYAWKDKNDPAITAADQDFIRLMARTCQLTMVRDPLASLMFKRLGHMAETVPCTAFLAASYYAKSIKVSRPSAADIDILFNYMPGGGHFDFDGINAAKEWERNFRAVYFLIKQSGLKTGFVCHSASERTWATQLDSAVPILSFSNPKDYFSALSNVKAAFVNRLHAAVGLSGMGVPCITVGTDTRMLMVRQLGITCHWVAELPDPEEISDRLRGDWRLREHERLAALIPQVKQAYLEKLNSSELGRC